MVHIRLHDRLTYKGENGEWRVNITSPEKTCCVHLTEDDKCYLTGTVIDELAYYENQEYGEDA